MSKLTTHVLDTAKGKPAAGITITVDLLETGGGPDPWKEVARATTNADGRVADFFPMGHVLQTGIYRLVFNVGPYLGQSAFYPSVPVIFQITDSNQHYHVPLLLSPYGYSTYRGS